MKPEVLMGAVDPRFPTLRFVRANDASPMTLDGTRTFLLGTRRVLVVDPGPEDEDHLHRVLDNVGAGEVVAVVLTHAHPDHAGNAIALAEASGAPLLMGAGALQAPFPGERVSRYLRDGERIASDAGPLTVLATPGHTPEHIAFVVPGNAGATALLVGDLLLGAGDTTVVSAPEGDVGVYFGSLARVGGLSVDLLVPAHGEVQHDVSGVVERYRAHRQQRVEQVRAARRALPAAGAEELARRIYGTRLDPRLWGAAVGSVVAVIRHLEKVEDVEYRSAGAIDDMHAQRGVRQDGTGDGIT